MASKKLSRLEKEYSKQRARLKAGIRYYEKQGYRWVNEMGELYDPLEGKSLEELKNLKPEQLLGEAMHQTNVGWIPALEYKEFKKQQEKEYPTLSVIEAIKDRINELPNIKGVYDKSVGFKGEPLQARKNELMRILDEEVNYNEYNDTLDQYIDYLISVVDIIVEELDRIKYIDSSSDQLSASFATVGTLIKGSPLTPDQAEALSRMAEYYNEG